MPDFKTVVMDPPWLEVGGGGRGAQNHYSVSKTSDMPDIITSCPYWNQIEKDAHLYMWVTNSFLADGLWLMKQLDFKYMTNIVWVKHRIGIGQYFRGKHELCLFGTRGRGFAVKTETRKITSVINANRTIHSKKPDEFMEMVEQRSHGPYLEIFARRERENWTSWGNEIATAEDEGEE